jgi:hypothetical protein
VVARWDSEAVSFAPPGLVGSSDLLTHGWRRGLHSFAPSELAFIQIALQFETASGCGLVDIVRC